MKLDTPFREHALVELFEHSQTVIDIGGGLRALPAGDRFEPERTWLQALVRRVDYKVLNIAAAPGVDIVGDIHALPFADNSIDAIICMAVLEHVKNPWRAAQELYRVLKPGGRLFVFVPFLFYYHTHGTKSYGDYWRFSEDGVRVLFEPFAVIQIAPSRGPLETWLLLNPLRRALLRTKAARFITKKGGVFQWVGRHVDRYLFAPDAKDTSGYDALLIK